MNPPAFPLDLLFDADRGISLNGDRVSRWHPAKGIGFLEQIQAVAQPEYTISGHQAVLRFRQPEHLVFQGFGGQGMHTWIFVCKAKAGLLLDSQNGGPTIQAPREGWQIHEVIRDAAINGRTVIGSDYYGQARFLHGDIAAIGYRRGLLGNPQREYVHRLLAEKFGDKECCYWNLRVKKPAWLHWIR